MASEQISERDTWKNFHSTKCKYLRAMWMTVKHIHKREKSDSLGLVNHLELNCQLNIGYHCGRSQKEHRIWEKKKISFFFFDFAIWCLLFTIELTRVQGEKRERKRKEHYYLHSNKLVRLNTAVNTNIFICCWVAVNIRIFGPAKERFGRKKDIGAKR